MTLPGMTIPEPYVCAFCLEEPAVCDCERTEGGGHWPRRACSMPPVKLCGAGRCFGGVLAIW